MGPLLALASATTFGVADFLGGIATSRSKVIAVTTVSNLTGAVVAAVLVLVVDGRLSAAAVIGVSRAEEGARFSGHFGGRGVRRGGPW